MIRNLFIAALVVSGLYAAATVPLGQRTLAEHVRAIGQTREAKALVAGAKSKIGPSLAKVKAAVLGEVKQSVGRMEKELREQADRALAPSDADTPKGHISGQAPPKSAPQAAR